MKNSKLKNNKLYKRLLTWFFIIIITTLIIMFLTNTNLNNNQPCITNGIYSFEENMLPERLIGEWAFTWNQLLDSSDFDKIDTFIKVPSFWNKELDCPEFGCATYMLKVTNITPGQDYSIKIPTVGTACNVYIDDTLVAQAGKAGKTKDEHSPQFKVIYHDFTAQNTSFILVVQISNFDYPRAGMWLPLKIAKADAMAYYRYNRCGLEYIIIGVLVCTLVLSILIIAAIRPSFLVYNLIFTILIAGLHQIVYGEKLILYWFPNTSMFTIVKLQYLVMYCMCLFSLKTIQYFCGSSVKKNGILEKINNVFAVLLFVLAASVVAAPIYFTTSLVVVGRFCVYLCMLLCTIMIINAVIENKPLIRYLLFSTMVLYICIIHDFLYRSTAINSIAEITVYGYFLVLISLGAIMLVETIRMQEKANLSEAYEQAYLNSQIKTHFLFNTLNTIANMVRKDSKKSEDLIVSLSTYLRNTIVRQNLKRNVTLEKEIETLQAYTNIIENRFKDIKILIEISDTRSIHLPPLTLQPLVENAVNHGLRKKKNGGTVSVSIENIGRDYIISVSDNGIGISEEKVSQLKSQLQKSITKLDDEIGIGLVNVNFRLQKNFNTQLDIASTLGEGTTVSFRISNTTN